MLHWSFNSKELQFIIKYIKLYFTYEMSDLKFLNFKLIFLRIYFYLLRHFFQNNWSSVCILNILQVLTCAIIYISSFQNELNHPCSLASCYFQTKIVEDSHEIWNCYVFQLLGFSQNVHFSGCDILSHLGLIQSTHFFQW